MPAGLNVKVRIWGMFNDDDDAVGGAQMSGTLRYDNISARIESQMPSPLLLDQGAEVMRMMDCIVRPGNLTIEEFDEVEIVTSNHPFCFERLLVERVQHSSLHPGDPRSMVKLKLSRKKYSRSEA